MNTDGTSQGSYQYITNDLIELGQQSYAFEPSISVDDCGFGYEPID